MRKIFWASVLMAGAAIFTLQAHADTPPGTTTVGGTMFTDFTDLNTDVTSQSTAGSTSASSNNYGTDVKRFYLIVDHGFDDVWSANLTTDFNYVSADGETQLFVKKAYVQAKLSDAAAFRLGSADMPWIPFDESVYGYRFVENTLIDRLHFGNSADWGVHFVGQSDGNFANYAVSMVNGGGYKNPTRSKSVDFEGRLAIMPVNGLIIAVGAYTGELGQDTSSLKPGTPINTATRQDALVAWKASGLTLGAEYFHASNFTPALITSNQTDSASGYSLFGSYDLTDDGIAVFARYDNADPSKDLHPSEKDKYYNFGVSFPANKNITWAIAYKHEDLSLNPVLTTTSAVTDTTTKEIGVWAQVKF
ncbi:MAG: carbohydrate porin [Gammaproteobacteria bacterium]